jgi:ribonuclease BN (tRNA processing enzyme)
VTEPLELLFLGSGNGFAPRGRYWSSFLLNGRYLFDCSPVALPHLKKCGVALAEIDAVFISHFHADHFFGLPFLLFEYGYVTQREKELTIVGPPGIEERVRTLTESGFPNTFSKDIGSRLVFEELADGRTGEVAGLNFVARSVDHVEDFPCFGYRAEVGGRALAYSGDSMMCDALVDLASGPMSLWWSVRAGTPPVARTCVPMTCVSCAAASAPRLPSSSPTSTRASQTSASRTPASPPI